MNYIKSMQNVLDLIHDNIQEHLAFNINILILIFLRYILFSISLFRSLVDFLFHIIVLHYHFIGNYFQSIQYKMLLKHLEMQEPLSSL